MIKCQSIGKIVHKYTVNGCVNWSKLFKFLTKSVIFVKRNTPETLYVYLICTNLKSSTLDGVLKEERGVFLFSSKLKC